MKMLSYALIFINIFLTVECAAVGTLFVRLHAKTKTSLSLFIAMIFYGAGINQVSLFITRIADELSAPESLAQNAGRLAGQSVACILFTVASYGVWKMFRAKEQ